MEFGVDQETFTKFCRLNQFISLSKNLSKALEFISSYLLLKEKGYQILGQLRMLFIRIKHEIVVF